MTNNQNLSRPPISSLSAFKHYKPRHYKVFGCICISSENRIALVKGALTGKWSFPKGHLENKETAQECAFRELLEETGIVLTNNHITLGPPKKFSRDGGEYFLYQFSEECPMYPRNPNEITDCGWFSEEDMRSMRCNKDVNSFLSLI